MPRSLAPASGGPYRDAQRGAACPRCQGSLHESEVQGAQVLDCTTCGGVFVAKSLIDALDRPEGRDLRIAFPRRARVPEPTEVRYLPCPGCGTRMNRTSFARGANVVVDVCKEDGIWFDAGEVHAVLDFVEGGGLERAKRRALQDRSAENQRLRKEWRKLHEESSREIGLGHRNEMSAGERELADAFFSWLWR